MNGKFHRGETDLKMTESILTREEIYTVAENINNIVFTFISTYPRPYNYSTTVLPSCKTAFFITEFTAGEKCLEINNWREDGTTWNQHSDAVSSNFATKEIFTKIKHKLSLRQKVLPKLPGNKRPVLWHLPGPLRGKEKSWKYFINTVLLFFGCPSTSILTLDQSVID